MKLSEYIRFYQELLDHYGNEEVPFRVPIKDTIKYLDWFSSKQPINCEKCGKPNKNHFLREEFPGCYVQTCPKDECNE